MTSAVETTRANHASTQFQCKPWRLIGVVAIIAFGLTFPSCHDSDDLYAAIKRGNVRSVKRLAADTSVFAQLQPVQVGPLNISYKMTPLQAAAFWGKDNVARELIAMGAPVNTTDSLGMTALHMACGSEQIDSFGQAEAPDFGVLPTVTMVRLLLDAGADVNARGYRDITPLHCAASIATKDVVRTLLDAGADANALVEVGNTVLTEAVSNPDPAVVELLVRRGAALETGNGIGATALMLAAYAGRTDMVSALLALGANPSAVDHQGFTALDYANGRPWPLKSGTVESRQQIIREIEAARTRRPGG